jgi:hypothetical protein
MLAKSPDVKLALFLEYERDPRLCENCGGVGFLSMFLATNGPFDSPGSSKYVSKFHNGKWWCAPAFEGENSTETMKYGTVSAPCPVCKGVKPNSDAPYVPMPDYLRSSMKMLSKRMSK